MLNRRQLRIKVMQTIYAMSASGSQNIDLQEKFLVKSMGDMEVLYYLLLDLFNQLHKQHQDLQEKSSKKHLASKEELQPNQKFSNNKVVKLITDSLLLSEKMQSLKSNFWKNHEEYIRLIYDKMIESQIYQDYVADSTFNFRNDRDFIVKLYSEVIAPDERLYEFLEDSSLTWLDDLPLVNTFLLKTFRQLKADDTSKELIIKLFKDIEDRDFAIGLFRETMLNAGQFDKIIEGQTPNWDKDRIADVDAILIRMAICEFQKFSSIPTRVTINEYIEIAKEYATPKSSIFINGVLDNLEKQMNEKGLINKIGRGLL